MLLIRADDTAFWHMEEPDVKWDPKAALQKWRGKTDPSWLAAWTVGRCWKFGFGGIDFRWVTGCST